MLTNSRKNRWSCLVGKYIVFAVPGTSVDSYRKKERKKERRKTVRKKD